MLTIDQTNKLRLMGNVVVVVALAMILAGVAACLSEVDMRWPFACVGLGGVLLVIN